MHWQEIGWNGVRCKVPASWEVSKTGRRYLLLEEKSEPVMEIKWAQVKGRFSHRSQLRRLAVQHRKKIEQTIKEVPIPAGWKTTLSAFRAVAFSWHGQSLNGFGAVLFCSSCKTATLIQFFRRDSTHPPSLVSHIMNTFRDHPRNNQILWALFDIRALIPAEFNLCAYRFDPGHFELVFLHKSRKITLQRWGPASVLLRNRELEEFAREAGDFPSNSPMLAVLNGFGSVEWHGSLAGTRWSRLRSCILRKPSCVFQRFWHVKEKNRILGVRVDAKKPVDQRWANRICRDYESV
jgi:hypothetical protein